MRNGTVEELADLALPCLQKDTAYAKDCLYWLLGKCKNTRRLVTVWGSYLDKKIPGSGKRVPMENSPGYCCEHRSRKSLGVGQAIGA